MRKIESNVIGIDQGDVVLFSDFEHDGEMWVGHGPREIKMSVAFSEAYQSKPNVFVTTSMIDVSNSGNLRGELQAENVTKKGFDIVFRTWGDTQIARCRVAWQAIGPVGADDVWDL